MNTKTLFLIFSAILILTACGQNPRMTSAQNEIKITLDQGNKTLIDSKDLKENECKICDFDFASYKGELKKEEVDGLLLALNDEYLALAIYERVNKDFNDPRPFINIRQAEARHAQRLKQLFEFYKIPVPENPWIGKAPKFQSVADACKAGVDAEIVNRQLYDKLFKSTAREDILIVYRALQRASEENHLPAFERCVGGGRRGNG